MTTKTGTSPAKPKRVLVADDNASNQELMSALLGRLGIEFHMVANGQQALEALANESFDLVFMDCQMPVMDGFTACARLRNFPGLESSIVIGLSAYEPSEALHRAQAAGMNDYMSKPVTLNSLRGMLAKWGCVGESPIPSTPALSTSNRAVLNPESVELLRSLMVDGVTLFERQVSGFLVELPRGIVFMRDSVSKTNLVEAAEEAHRLKTLCGIIGAERMVDLCDRIQNAPKTGTPTPLVRADIDELETEFERVRSVLGGQETITVK